jgi:uncharacterized LabA/DUF88 family protein
VGTFRVGVFADVSNLYFCCREKYKKKLDYLKLLKFAEGKDNLIKAIAYGIHSTDSNGFKNALKNIGWQINFKNPKSFSDGSKKADCDIMMVMDIVRSIDMVDKIVLCTADGDFAPLVIWCHEKGRSVQIIGSGISHELTDIVDGYTEISEKFLEGEYDFAAATK